MLEIEIDNKKIKIPRQWDDVNFRQLLEIVKSKDGFDLIATFLNIEPERLKKATGVQNFHTIDRALSFLHKQKLPELKTEFAIQIKKDLTQIFPFDAQQSFTYAQYLDMQQTAFQLKKEFTNLDYFTICQELVQMYLQPILTNQDYDFSKIEDVKEKVLNMKAWEVYSMGSFFLKSCQRSQNGMVRRLKKLGTLRSKLWLAFIIWKDLGVLMSFRYLLSRSTTQ